MCDVRDTHPPSEMAHARQMAHNSTMTIRHVCLSRRAN